VFISNGFALQDVYHILSMGLTFQGKHRQRLTI